MANPYTSVSISGYNANPPSDDGTQASQNEVQWSKHKTKLGDPLKTAIETINTNVSSAFESTVTPPGTIASYAGLTAPTGWLLCDGTTGLNSVTDTTLADLFGVIGVQYGGTGADDFDLPDLRGYFIRGFDNSAGNDPDSASRTDRGDGTTGDNIGTKQASAFKKTDVTLKNLDPSGIVNATNLVRGGSGGNLDLQGGSLGGTSDLEVNGGSDNETRPSNICFNYIIKK